MLVDKESVSGPRSCHFSKIIALILDILRFSFIIVFPFLGEWFTTLSRVWFKHLPCLGSTCDAFFKDFILQEDSGISSVL